jgi:precorrin-8X/cobalt-precorrin-8 methylmutase
MTPDEIYAESFRMIEAEAGAHGFDATEWPVVRRMIHASGDLEILRSVVFTNGAAAAGIAAFRGGVGIVSDVTMVASGISKPHAAALGVSIRCFIDDPDVREQAAARGLTRSSCAMAKAVIEAGDAVYVVGNAPTALLTLCDAIREGAVRPRLVVAMPVGFVSVVESKEQASLLSGTPVATVRGRKGGSAVAAAAVNAMLRMATGEPLP